MGVDPSPSLELGAVGQILMATTVTVPLPLPLDLPQSPSPTSSRWAVPQWDSQGIEMRPAVYLPSLLTPRIVRMAMFILPTLETLLSFIFFIMLYSYLPGDSAFSV